MAVELLLQLLGLVLALVRVPETDPLGADLAKRLHSIGIGEVEHIGGGDHAGNIKVRDHLTFVRMISNITPWRVARQKNAAKGI